MARSLSFRERRKKMARPKIDIDPEQVLKLASIGCTASEISNFFGVSHKTISKRFSNEMIKGKDTGKISLRRLMFESARKGNVAIQIFLSKNLLGYSDKLEQSHSGEVKTINLNYSIPKKLNENNE